MNPALFLDRDGTINYDPGYIKSPDQIKLLPGVSEGIARIKQEIGFKVIVISNQSGIARGFLTHEDVDSVNNRINEILSDNSRIDAFYYCPFHPEFSNKEQCNCRKPSPKMVFDASKDHEIDLSKSYFLGDRGSDILCGIKAGIKTIFLENQKYSEEIISLHKEGKTPNFVAGNFFQACEFIINDYWENYC